MKKNMKSFLTITFMLCFVFNALHAQDHNSLAAIKTVGVKSYKYRKYNHVKRLYERLALLVTELCIEYKVPPAAVLSIMSLESGWGKGYIGKITGNFLSLNAARNDAELPALKMPKSVKTKQFILDKKILAKYSKEEIIWEMRPASLKKDYRPKGMAGTTSNLDYFLNNPEALTQANLENVKDFVTRFISYASRIKAYNQARKLLDDEIEKNGVEILFSIELNQKFIKTIGGKPNSFNFRKTWPKKVINILKNVGAVELTNDLYLNKQSFKEAW